MDLDEAWGERYLQLGKPPALEYIGENNDWSCARFRRACTMAVGFALPTETPKPQRVWLRIVGDKERSC